MNYEIKIKNMRTDKLNYYAWEFRVDRASVVGNPFYMSNESKRNEVCDKYGAYFNEQIKTNKAFQQYLETMLNALRTYKKVYLYCWCYPKRCHAETIQNWLLKSIKGENE